MAEPGKNNPAVMTAILALCDNDIRKAVAASGVASARFLGILASGYPAEQFESSLAKTLKLFEEVARSEKKYWENKNEKA